MTSREYFRFVQRLIDAHPLISGSTVTFREIDVHECYIKGELTLISGHELFFAEYVITDPSPERIKYRYHLQKSDGSQVVRWDNAPHHRQLATFPHHRHDEHNAPHPADEMDLESVLDEVARFI